MKRLALAAIFALGGAARAPAQDGASVALPLPLQADRLDHAPAEPFAIAPGVELIVQGEALGDRPLRAALRLDDVSSRDYASRVNDERLLPPGPFTWRILPAGARTSGGRVLDSARVTRLMLFPAQAQARIVLRSALLRAPAPLPAGAQGFSLGAAAAPLFPGFTRIAPGDARIEAGLSQPILRPGADALIASGLRGVERARLPWPEGRARVSLWTEDIGEWETLPHAFERRVRVNGADLFAQRLTPEQWIAQRYLAGRDAEPGHDLDPWRVHGLRRGGLVTGEVDVGKAGVLIELAGESANSAFLAAALIEPAGAARALDDVQARRAQTYRDLWRVAPSRAQDGGVAPAIMPAQGESVAPAITLALAPGSGARLRFAVRVSADAPIERRVEMRVESPVPLRLWAAQRRLERRAVSLNLLEARKDFLRAPASALPLDPIDPRLYEGWVSAPPDLAPGRHDARITLSSNGARLIVPLVIESLDVALPPAQRPAGYYLDEAPHLSALPSGAAARRRQIACDLAFLCALGVEGNAPPYATPLGASEDSFLVDALAAAAAGAPQPALAYAPAKRVRVALGIGEGARKLAQASAALRALGLTPPVWSVADEPALEPAAAQDLAWWTQALRATDPRALLAAQLNHPAHARLLDLVDVAIVNPAFGLDAPDIALARGRSRDVWLYNTDAPRLTAGLWLRAVGASRYLQWHARMPTADPFDPTDGRESDVQTLFPTPEACPAQHDIQADLLAMAEGLVDQRWLAWLEARAQPQAKALYESIAASAPERWKDARARLHDQGDGALAAMRNAILDLARALK